MKKIIFAVLLVSILIFVSFYVFADIEDYISFNVKDIKEYESIRDFKNTIDKTEYNFIDRNELVGKAIEVYRNNSQITKLANMIKIDGEIYINANDVANILDVDYFSHEPDFEYFEEQFQGLSSNYVYVYRVNDKEIVFTDLSNKVLVNNKTIEIEGECVPAFMRDERGTSAYLPLRAFTEILDYEIKCDDIDNELIKIHKNR